MKNNLLIEYGKAAASLCNDWRDTIFYTGVAATAVANTALGWGMPPSDFVFAASQRELARWVAWGGVQPFINIGSVVPNYRHAFSASTALGTLWLTQDFMRISEKVLRAIKPSIPNVGIDVLLDLGVLGTGAAMAGGFKAVAKDYRDTLWDWPRKNKPPGGRRNLIVERFRDLADLVRDTIRPPRPAWGAAFAPKSTNQHLVPAPSP